MTVAGWSYGDYVLEECQKRQWMQSGLSEPGHAKVVALLESSNCHKIMLERQISVDIYNNNVEFCKSSNCWCFCLLERFLISEGQHVLIRPGRLFPIYIAESG